MKVAQSCLRILQAKILEWVAFPFSRGLPNPGIKLRSPVLQADSLLAEPQGKPYKTASIFYKQSYVRKHICISFT